MRPKTPAYVVRKGESFLFRRRPPVHPSLARRGLNTRRHIVVALRTRDPHEAARRAARVGVLFDVGSRMALSVEEMEALLRLAIRATASLPEDLPASARAEAEAAIDRKPGGASPACLAGWAIRRSWTPLAGRRRRVWKTLRSSCGSASAATSRHTTTPSAGERHRSLRWRPCAPGWKA